MLIEYALTPELFDESLHGNDPTWRERLRQLGRAFFPVHSPQTAIISDLYGGTWLHQFGQTIDAAQHPATADLLRRLRSQIEKTCVTRPMRGDYPMDEAGWVASAYHFDSDARIDRVVTSDVYAKECAGESRLYGLTKTAEEVFWNGSGPTRHPEMNFPAQIGTLAPICLHSNFLAFVSPHVRFAGKGDFDFVVALFRHFEAKPGDFARPALFDIHTKAVSDQKTPSQNAQRTIEEIVQRVPHRRAVVRLFLWPKFVERLLLGGDVNLPLQNPRPRTRWCISFTHVCHQASDGPHADRPTWTVLISSEISRWRTRFYGTPGHGTDAQISYPRDSPFSGSPIILHPSA